MCPDQSDTTPAAALVRRLRAGAGRGLLESLPPYDERQTLALAVRLRDEGFDPDLVAAALTQSRLRARATGKFGELAADLFFTSEGLEQATRWVVARRHAARLATSRVHRVWDLGCGIGTDALALARSGMRVEAVDRDPLTAAVAEANLAGEDAAVHLADVDRVRGEIDASDGAWLDPARRTGVADVRGRSRRLSRLEDLSPAWDLAQEIARSVAAAGIKLAPGLSRRQVPDGVAAEWVSVAGTAVEATLWWGHAAPEPGVRAAVHHGGTWTEVRDVGPASGFGHPRGHGDLGAWLYDPDRAVLAADLVGSLAAEVDGQEIDPGVGYVTSDRAVELPWARRLAVTDVLPLHPKALRAWARDHGVGSLTIKKRGVPTDPDALRRRLRVAGDGPEGILVLTRLAGRPVALAVAASP